jgi:hypothetical protein
VACRQVPELRRLLDEHLEDNDGELLPYVAFEGAFLRWFVDQVREGDRELARRFVEAIELLMTTDVVPSANDRVWNLAAVCFVEGLQNDPDVVDAARPWMGSNTPTRSISANWPHLRPSAALGEAVEGYRSGCFRRSRRSQAVVGGGRRGRGAARRGR